MEDMRREEDEWCSMPRRGSAVSSSSVDESDESESDEELARGSRSREEGSFSLDILEELVGDGGDSSCSRVRVSESVVSESGKENVEDEVELESPLLPLLGAMTLEECVR